MVDGLRDLYMQKILPIEKSSNFSAFHPNGIEIRDCEWESRPQVLLIGQYSTGKTSFIRHLLGGKDFPGIHIGPVSINLSRNMLKNVRVNRELSYHFIDRNQQQINSLQLYMDVRMNAKKK